MQSTAVTYLLGSRLSRQSTKALLFIHKSTITYSSNQNLCPSVELIYFNNDFSGIRQVPSVLEKPLVEGLATTTPLCADMARAP